MQSRIEVRLAYIVTQKDEIRLTKDMARQLDVRPMEERWNKAELGQEPQRAIAKVLGRTINAVPAESWFLLIEHPEATFAWTLAVNPCDLAKRGIVARGGWVDDLTRIPTILV